MFLEMWSRLGKYIRHLEFERTFLFKMEKYVDLLQHFPNLKILKINFNYWRQETYRFKKIPMTVEKLILTFGPYHGTIKAFEKLVVGTKSLRELELEDLELNEDFVMYLPKIARILRKLKIKVHSDQIGYIKNLQGPYVTHLSIKQYGPEMNNILHIVLYGFPRLEHLSLTTRDMFPTRNYIKLKSLIVINLEYEEDCMKNICLFTELEDLVVTIWEPNDTDCFFGHTIYSNSSVKSFKIVTHKTIICEECLNTLVKSFVNLKFFDIDLDLCEKHIKMVRSSLRFLNELEC